MPLYALSIRPVGKHHTDDATDSNDDDVTESSPLATSPSTAKTQRRQHGYESRGMLSKAQAEI